MHIHLGRALRRALRASAAIAALTVVSSLAACLRPAGSAPPPARTQPPPAVYRPPPPRPIVIAIPVARMPTADDVSSEYVAVSKEEERPGRVRVQLDCRRMPERFELAQQADGRVVLVREPERFASGAAPPPAPVERAEGRAGDPLLLTGERRERYPVEKVEPVRYELRFDPASAHLVGARNAAPIRLAPVELVPPPEPCPPAA